MEDLYNFKVTVEMEILFIIILFFFQLDESALDYIQQAGKYIIYAKGLSIIIFASPTKQCKLFV